MQEELTGRYRLYKQKIGKAGTKTILITGSIDEIEEYYNNCSDEQLGLGYTLFKEQEVIYKDTHLDENGNYSDSSPTWRNIPI
jgi:hypothetical protein